MKKFVMSLLAGVVVAVCTACGGDADSRADAVRVERPCDIPAATLTEAGVETQPLMTEPFGIEFSEWEGCIWKSTAGWYDVAVYFGPETTDEFQSDPRYGDYQASGPTEVGDLAAVEFGDALDPERQERCYIGVDLAEGMALVWSRLPVGPGGAEPQGDICAEGKRVAAAVSSHLPV